MTVRFLIACLVVSVSAPAAIASAQSSGNTPPEASASIATGKSVSVESANGSGGAAEAPSRGEQARLPLFVRLYAGAGSTAGATGVGLAGGVAARPFRRQALEVEGDLSVFHYASSVFDQGATSNTVEFTGDFVYNFTVSHQKIVPFAGGGLVVSHGRDDTRLFENGLSLGGIGAGLDLMGGIQLPINRDSGFRAVLHVHEYGGGSAVIVLAGLSFKID